VKIDIRRTVSTVIFLIGIIQLPLWGQQAVVDSSRDYAELVERAYGQDQELVNGMQYYDRHPRSLRHPYLMEGWVHQGSVQIRGMLYSGVWLRYDILDQQVEVEYLTMNGAENQVILVSDRVDEFNIGWHYFKKLKLEEAEQFYQVIGSDRLVFYIHWQKKLVPVSGNAQYVEEYTMPKRTYLMDLDGAIHEFGSKKSLIKSFPVDIQKDVKKLIRMNRVQIKVDSPEQLELFIIAVNNLLNSRGA